MDVSYENLFINIWGQAVKDDVVNAVNELCNYGFIKAVKEYNLNVLEPLNERNIKFKALKKSIKKHSIKIVIKLVPRIKELIKEESLEWPGNKNFKNSDEKYNIIFNELKDEIKDFSLNEVQTLIHEK